MSPFNQGLAFVLMLSVLVLPACGQKTKRGSNVPDFPEETGTDWFNLDSSEGGLNIDRLYEQHRFDSETLVAVIDSGVDFRHEDLQGHIWTNTKEIPDNGVDDDGNGYVDDIHGWNFLVDKEGKTYGTEVFEVVRELKRMRALEAQRVLTAEEDAYRIELQSDYDQELAQSPEDFRLTLDWEPRADDLDDFTLINAQNPAYGNGDINWGSSHGTHVAGIVAAVRNNNLGIKGIADNARIMILRAIPNGDEHDKDIFHAIHYAVDQGARVINMSFGKAFSPHPDKVKEAFQYAYNHGVLLVHAAGNSGDDMDQSKFFPSRAINGDSAFNKGWLEIGAVAQGKTSPIAGFSNYGRTSVDVFAPGVAILSTLPGNRYQAYSGTSMASPTVAGTAALMLGAFPNLTPEQLRNAIIETARTEDTSLSGKSIAGGVLDAEALYENLQAKRGAVTLRRAQMTKEAGSILRF